MQRLAPSALLGTSAICSLVGGFLAQLLVAAPGAAIAADEKKIGDADTVIEAKEVRLMAGKAVRGLLAVDDKGSVSFSLCDGKSSPRLMLNAGADGATMLIVRDEAGLARVSIGLADKDTGMVILKNGDGKKAAAITAAAGSPVAFSAYDADGKSRAMLSVAADGRPMLLLSDKERLRLQVSCMSDGSPGILLFDPKGEQGWGVSDKSKK